MFSRIAGVYDFMNSVLTFRLHRRWRDYAVGLLDLRGGEVVADVCAGTGDFAFPLRQRVGEKGVVVGVDFCFPMLEVSRRKGAPMMSVLGDACALPLRSSVLDAVTVGWGLRNVADLQVALREIFRVLRKGGKFVCLDTAIPRNGLVRAFWFLVGQWLIPFLGWLIGKREEYAYLPQTTQQWASREELALRMKEVGFANVGYSD
ncbi:MAG: ubiquinone/menaquinone biosynthesis methyltransferase, partial [Candidatus Caldarchaeum sp.]